MAAEVNFERTDVMRYIIAALAVITLSTTNIACFGKGGSTQPVGGAAPQSLDTDKGPVSPIAEAAEREKEVAAITDLAANRDEAEAEAKELAEALNTIDRNEAEREVRILEARAIIADIRAAQAARAQQANARITAQDAEDEAARLREAEAEAEAERVRAIEIANERERIRIALEVKQAEADRIEEERLEREARLREKAEADRIAREKAAIAAAAADKEEAERRDRIILIAQCKHEVVNDVEKCDSVGVDIRDRLARAEDEPAPGDAANVNAGVVPTLPPEPVPANRNAGETPGAADDSEHDHHDFFRLLGKLVPYVECEAEFIKESKFRIFLGHVHGEMLITCSKGIHGEEFTTIARIVGAEIGLGWKTHLEEGIMRIHGLGIGPHNFLGASVQVKAALSSGDYQTDGQGGLVSLGVAGSAFQYVGFVHATGTVEGHGGALTLEIAVWYPKCDSEQGLAAKHGYSWDAMAAEARAEGKGGVGCDNRDPRDKPIHDDFPEGPDR